MSALSRVTRDPLRSSDDKGFKVEEQPNGTAVVITDGLQGMRMPFSCFEAAQRWVDKIKEVELL